MRLARAAVCDASRRHADELHIDTTEGAAMSLTRRDALSYGAKLGVASAVGLGLSGKKASAAEFNLKIGHGQTTAHPLDPRLKEAAEKIKTETGGRVEVQVLGNSALGSEAQMMTQVRSGSLDMLCTSILFLEGTFPAVSISGLAFAYKNNDEGWAAWDGEFGNYLRAGVEKQGILVFDKIFEHGFREMTSAVRPINQPEDLKGLKIRVPAWPILTSMCEQFGAAPTTIGIKEVYSALQTRIADGQENPLASIEFFKFYEVQKYCSMTNHIWDPFCMFASPRRMNALPKDIQGIVISNINAAALKQRAEMRHLNETLRTKLSDSGLIFNDPDIGLFRKKLSELGFYKHWKEKYDPAAWALLEKYTGALG
jgi:tripartite ATP-independent transporter DctP family solute receptor